MVEYESEKSVGNSFVQVFGKNGMKLVWVARFLQIMKMNARYGSEPAYFAFLQFVECTETLNK